jgi:hypothetical protein
MGERRGRWLGLVFAAVTLSTGCETPPDDGPARLAALEAEAREMDEALDTVETRLLGNQASLLMWQELGRRHKQVSAVHCQHADAHLEAIVNHYKKQEEKARGLKKRRVAAVDSAVLTSGKAPKRSRN